MQKARGRNVLLCERSELFNFRLPGLNNLLGLVAGSANGGACNVSSTPTITSSRAIIDDIASFVPPGFNVTHERERVHIHEGPVRHMTIDVAGWTDPSFSSATWTPPESTSRSFPQPCFSNG